jgi:hypothetical protein
MSENRRFRAQAGQATVEFVWMSLALILFMWLAWQMAWVGVQKWYFNFTAAYAARAWSVYPTDDRVTTQEMLIKTQGLAFFYHPALSKMPLVKIIKADAESPGGSDPLKRYDDGMLPPGIRYRGLAYYLGWFQPSTVNSAGFQSGTNGAIIFETYIPMEHEESFSGKEDPNRYDNDRAF